MVGHGSCLARDVLIFSLAFIRFDKTIDNRKAYFMNDPSSLIFSCYKCGLYSLGSPAVI